MSGSCWVCLSGLCLASLNQIATNGKKTASQVLLGFRTRKLKFCDFDMILDMPIGKRFSEVSVGDNE